MNTIAKSITIRPLTHVDLPRCLQSIHDGWGRKWTARANDEFALSLSTHLARPQFYVADECGHITGIAGYAPSWADENVYSIVWVAVNKTHRFRGIGRLLVDHCLTDVSLLATRTILSTHVPEFYAKNWGFQEIAHWTAKSIDQGDRVSLMILDLENPLVAPRYR